MSDKNLFAQWSRKQQAHEYWRKNGTTASGIPVKILDLPNGWSGTIFGPRPRPIRSECETDAEYQKLILYHNAYWADLEYFWVIPYFVWSAKSIYGNDLKKIESECFSYAKNLANIYDPDKSLVDGVWYDRPDIYDARVRYKAKLDAQFEAERQLYLSKQN